MVTTVVLVLAPVVLVLLIFLVVIRFLKGRQQRWYSGTGLAEWNEKASTLPWRDRLALHRANTRGRAVERRLAPLAVERGMVMLRVQACMRERGSPWWWFRIVMIVVVVGNVVLAVRRLGSGGGWFDWLMLTLWVLYLGLLAAEPAVRHRTGRKIERSIALNQAVTEESRE